MIQVPVGRQQIEAILKTIVTEGSSKKNLKDDFAKTALLQLFILVSRYVTTGNGNQPTNNYNIKPVRCLAV